MTVAAPARPAPVARAGLAVRSLAGLLGRDAGLVLVGRVLNLVAGLLVGVVLTGRFGLEAMGAYAVATPLIAFTGLVGALGLPQALPRAALGAGERTTVALVAGAMLLPTALLLDGAYASLFAADRREALLIAAFALGGVHFALNNTLATLLIMEDRAGWTALPPAAALAGVIAGGLWTSSPLGFALGLLVARTAGLLLVLPVLPVRRVARAKLRTVGREAARFLPGDVLAMLSDQGVGVALAALLSRGDLGLYGLCRQLVTAADTPVWSTCQVIYPRMVRDRLASARRLERSVLRLAAAVVVAGLAAALVLGFGVYGLPAYAGLAALFLAAVPARYLVNFYTQVLRAGGRVAEATRQTALNAGLALLVLPAAAVQGGVWGVALAFPPLAFVGAALYARGARRLFPPA